jgi:hypothetical protein
MRERLSIYNQGQELTNNVRIRTQRGREQRWAWGRHGDDLSTARKEAAKRRFPTPSGMVTAAAGLRIDRPSTCPQRLLLFQGSLVFDQTQPDRGRSAICLTVLIEPLAPGAGQCG